MKNSILTAIFIATIFSTAFAQFTTVSYDLERNWFNEGQPLPAEESMIFKSMMPENTQVVELSILSAKKQDELYRSTWHKTSGEEMSLIIPFMLRSSDKYDVRFDLFRAVTSAEQAKLKKDMIMMLDTYVDINVTGEKEIKLAKSTKKTVRDLNEVVSNTMSEYRTKKDNTSFEFSEMLSMRLEQLQDSDLSKNYSKKDSTTTRAEVRNMQRTELVNALKMQMQEEVSQMLNADLFVLDATRIVDDYVTETKRNSIALNVGYGGVYLSGNWDDFTYGSSPYLGVAFPLGNSVLGSKFLSNSSVTVGVFLNNFEDANGNEVRGLIVNRPLYAGLDYKLFKFIRLNAGATFLEGKTVTENIDIPGDFITSKNVMVRPYIGLSARIDLSIGFGK